MSAYSLHGVMSSWSVCGGSFTALATRTSLRDKCSQLFAARESPSNSIEGAYLPQPPFATHAGPPKSAMPPILGRCRGGGGGAYLPGVARLITPPRADEPPALGNACMRWDQIEIDASEGQIGCGEWVFPIRRAVMGTFPGACANMIDAPSWKKRTPKIIRTH